MALSTQILLLCLCTLAAECFFYELGDPDYLRIPQYLNKGYRFSLSNIFDNPYHDYSQWPSWHTVKPHAIPQKDPFTSADATTARMKVTTTTMPITSVTTTQSATDTTPEDNDIEVTTIRHAPLEDKDEDIDNNATEKPSDEEEDPDLNKNINDNRDPADTSLEENEDDLKVTALSIGDAKPEPILSVTIPQNDDEEDESKVEGPKADEDDESKLEGPKAADVQRTVNDISDTETESTKNETKDDPVLSKKTDFLLIPVTAAASIPIQDQSPVFTNNQNILTPIVNPDSTNYQVYSTPNSVNTANPGIPLTNMLSNHFIPVNNVPNTNVPNSLVPFNDLQNNGALSNYYPMPVPNNVQGISNGNMPNNNVYYVLSNPNSMNNIGYQNQNQQQYYSLVPINNPQNNVGWNQQPLVPSNNPQYYLPNSDQSQFVGISNQPNNLIPVNSQSINFIGNNQPNTNYVPWNNQPNPPITYPYNNNNFVPVNNVPNNNVPNNFVPYNDQQNVVLLNNQPVAPNNNVPVLVQFPANPVTLFALKDKEGDEAVDEVKESL